ncbi:MAG TPA: tyrosine/phenylalanine carboxypeptidase domain-containing protein [Xanthomonadaceae bacterium]|nr:tyrosine/phenylalanine carboxypeptidase domain-containing protein [Xanthomonadaceae bacterium]
MASANATGTRVPYLAEDGAYRQPLGSGGRVHLDRPLPFLVVNRHPDVAFSLAQRVAAITPANLVWPADDDADGDALECVRTVLDRHRRDGPFLLVSLHDLPQDPSLDDESARLEHYRFALGASADAPAQATATCLAQALSGLCLDLREPVVDAVPQVFPEPGLAELAARHDGLSCLSLGVPQVYRIPGEERIYPQVFHALEAGVFDALLRGFSAFLGAAGQAPPRHHRALGRSSFVDAALKVDRELHRISGTFDFLLSVSPINTGEAYAAWRAGRRRKPPEFRYRPLTVSPERSKRALYAIDMGSVEDPVLETLFREKQLEIDQQLLMLQFRNTPKFSHASVLQYGPVSADLLAQARAVLEAVPPGGDQCAGTGDDATVDCHEVKAAAEALVARYRRAVPEFEATVSLREDIGPGLMVTGNELLVSTDTRMRRGRLDPLLQHEVSVHVLTCINGRQQGLGIFGDGLAGYEGIQEGLGVFAEFAVDGLTDARLRLLAARVVAVDAMLGGATFNECHRLLADDHGFSDRGAFNIAARVYRSGGLAKDAIYLRGLQAVFDFIATGRDLDPFWFGKIAGHHVPVVDELLARGMLRSPPARPEFLSRPSAARHVARIREGCSFIDLIRGHPC